MGQPAHIGSFPFRTMTVGELRERLARLRPDAEVLFCSPFNGGFGPNQHYTVEAVEEVHMPRREHHTPAMEAFDEETGKPYMTEPDTQVWEAWSGVIIR